jgi:hypothetical protein
MSLPVEKADNDGYLGKRFEESREVIESWQSRMRAN